jgi:hypothetical protein
VLRAHVKPHLVSVWFNVASGALASLQFLDLKVPPTLA